MGSVYKRIKNPSPAKAILHSEPEVPAVGMSTVLRSSLPVFNLAPLTEYPPETFASDDRDLDAFMLMLALAYNDLKGFEWTHDVMRKAEPTTPLVDPQVGQLVGMKVWAMRFTVALLNELLDAIRAASEAGVTSKARFKDALKLLKPSASATWIKLERLANEQYEPHESAALKAAKRWFVQLRSNMVHHYKQPKPLRDGYVKFFLQNPPSIHNRAAFVSLGRTMEQIRFFFADAAAIQYYRDGAGQHSQKHLNKLRALVNAALLVSIHSYLELRRRELAAEVKPVEAPQNAGSRTIDGASARSRTQ